MKYFSKSVCDYIAHQIERHINKQSQENALLMLPSYPADVLVHIGRELDASILPKVDGLVFKIAKPLWEEWQTSSTPSVLTALDEAFQKGWLDTKGNLTNYRNTVAQSGVNLVVMAGIDHVTDKASLSDFHCCDIPTIWGWKHGLNFHFTPWVEKCLNDRVSYENETLDHFDATLKTIMMQVPSDIIRISEYLDGLNLSSAQDGRDAEQILLESLDPFGLPNFSHFRFGGRKKFQPYIDAALSFASYAMFLEEGPRKKYLKAVQDYQKINGADDELFDAGVLGSYSTDNDFLDDLSLYINQGGKERLDRLFQCDFTVILDKILKFRVKSEPKEKIRVEKLGTDPVESILAALWTTLSDFKKAADNRGVMAHDVISDIFINGVLFKYEREGSSAEERKEKAKIYLEQLLGGVDTWLTEYIQLSHDSEKTIPVHANLIHDSIDYQYSATAEPFLEFTITIKSEIEDNQTVKRFRLRLPENSPYCIADDLFQWVHKELIVAKKHFLPVFFIPYYDELMLAKDDEEASRVLMHGIRAEGHQIRDILQPILKELKIDERSFGKSLEKMAFEYCEFIKKAANEGLFTALIESWDNLRLAAESAFEAYLCEDSNVDNDHGLILERSFLFLKQPSSFDETHWIWKRDGTSATVSVLHPALIEMVHARTTYLFECFNVEARKQLQSTSPKSFNKSIWEYYLGLSSIKRPLNGLLKNGGLFEAAVRGNNLLHRIGYEKDSDATLSTRLLLRYDSFEEDDITDQALFAQTRESLMLYRLMKDYWNLHPHAKDSISIAFFQNQDIQPIIAAIDKFISDPERRQWTEGSPYQVAITLFSESNDNTGVTRWIDQWKERWEAAENHEKFSHYRECRLSIAYRIVASEKNYEQFKQIINTSLEADIFILNHFINADEHRFKKIEKTLEITSRPIKFPILEKAFCSPAEGRHSHERYRILSNRQFRIATKHLEVMVRLTGCERGNYIALGHGNFKPWQDVIDAIHKKVEWVVCIDSSIDERLLQETADNFARDIIGFGSGVGSHGEANYTISTEQFHLSDLIHKLKASISNIVTGWSEDDHAKAAQFAITRAKELSGLSLIRATGIGEHIRDVMAYALAREYFHAEKGCLCDHFISLDAYRHWFDGADSKSRPDILWLVAKITANGTLHIDVHVIECKMGQKAEIHIDKAHEQVENGLRHLIPVFMPRKLTDSGNRPDARYWWLQLHRLIASKSQIETTKRSETLSALERLVEGEFSISWGAAFFTIWTNINTEKIDSKLSWPFQFKDQSIRINHISVGSFAARNFCNGEKITPVTWYDNCLLYDYASSPVDDSENVLYSYMKNDEFNNDEDGLGTDDEISVGKNRVTEVADNGSKVVPKIGSDNNGSPIPNRILLGRSTKGNRPIFWEFGHHGLHNRHMLIFGSSGMGKTYAIQCLLNELSEKGQNSLIIDYTNGFLPDQLEPLTIENLRPKQHIIRQEPLPISPFKLQAQNIGGIIIPESHSTAAKRTAAIFKTVYNLGDQQFSVLFDAIMNGLDSFGNNFHLEDLLNVLESYLDDKSHAKATAQSTLSKLKPFVLDKPFLSDASGMGWDFIFSDRNFFCHVFQLAGLDMHSWRLVTEFILWDLYAYLRATGNRNKPKVVVLDEVQNLDHREECPLAKYMTEGRKFGLSLILATQTLSNLSTDQQSRLFQSGHKLFFKPAETEMQEYGKVLQNATGEPSKTWIERLSRLKKGECYSLGSSLGDDGVLKTIASKIIITALEDRSTRA